MTTYDKKRVAAAFLLALVVAAGANWHFDLVFPRFSRLIAALSVVMMVIYFIRFAPTRKDFEEHRRHHTGGRN